MKSLSGFLQVDIQYVIPARTRIPGPKKSMQLSGTPRTILLLTELEFERWGCKVDEKQTQDSYKGGLCRW